MQNTIDVSGLNSKASGPLLGRIIVGEDGHPEFLSPNESVEARLAEQEAERQERNLREWEHDNPTADEVRKQVIRMAMDTLRQDLDRPAECALAEAIAERNASISKHQQGKMLAWIMEHRYDETEAQRRFRARQSHLGIRSGISRNARNEERDAWIVELAGSGRKHSEEVEILAEADQQVSLRTVRRVLARHRQDKEALVPAVIAEDAASIERRKWIKELRDRRRGHEPTVPSLKDSGVVQPCTEKRHTVGSWPLPSPDEASPESCYAPDWPGAGTQPSEVVSPLLPIPCPGFESRTALNS